MLAQPYERPDIKLAQPQFFLELTLQAAVNGLARFNSTAWCDPEAVIPTRRADAH
jgi:hypothetical protein